MHGIRVGTAPTSMAWEDVCWNRIPESTTETTMERPREAELALSQVQSLASTEWLLQEVMSSLSLVGFKKSYVKIGLHNS